MSEKKKYFPITLLEAGVLGLEERTNTLMKKRGAVIYALFNIWKKFTRVNWIYFACLLAIVLFIAYTKFVGMNWGLPYPMHPDERNMAVAITNMKCEFLTLPPLVANPWGYLQQLQIALKDCFNPHFFAYGQPPLFLGMLLAKSFFVTITPSTQVNFVEAVMGLRLLSALSALVALYFSWKILSLLLKSKGLVNWKKSFAYLLILGIVPYGIQFAHFGTTESFLMACYMMIIYLSLLIANQKNYLGVKFFAMFTLLANVTAFALASKLSSLLFVPIVLLAILKHLQKGKYFWSTKVLAFLGLAIFFITYVMVFSLVFSPHNYFSMTDFISSMNYETAVATGSARVFYTRQFEQSIGGIFQVFRVFPYVLGWPTFLLAIVGILTIGITSTSWLLLGALVFVLFPSLFLYAKWSRFLAPIYPLFSVFSVLGLEYIIQQIKSKNLPRKTLGVVYILSVIMMILPGYAYLSIYQKPDVRFVASKWMFDNFADGDIVLSETANVVDTPIGSKLTGSQVPPKIEYISFQSYDVDGSVDLQNKFKQYQSTAKYVLVPSRRVVANHTCIDWTKEIGNVSKVGNLGYISKRCEYYQNTYPVLNQYYQDLYSGKLGFEKVAQFQSFPRIEIFGKEIYKINDEKAEESWTVFDHPVIRVYKRK